ncbi:putative carbonic anhydrase 5 [Anoplophora glabripennis]|uniref:putative carbonic anhydrase 5 n=1 Tax=Anoplophora glabripennis TaxID=217634 RepID=UPI000C78A968|nr:putative carbonic anhydrase 5 [Anoplophora glabripennis]
MHAAPVICLIAVLLAAGPVSAGSWTYQDEQHWARQCQEGHLQSPIPLSLEIAKEKEFHHLRLQGYSQTVKAILKNNGHSAEVRLDIPEDQKPIASGGGLAGSYQLDHLHFHWQSEHTLEGHRFPLELHLVHYGKDYGSLSNAVRHPQGVAVFAVMFELSPDDDEEFQPLLNIIAELQNNVGTPRQLAEFNVKNFLPRDTAGFYRYEGSLTTPDCNEGILWTVFTNTIPISAKQVKIFEAMHDDHNALLEHNYRSLQSLNGRDVYVKISPIRASAKAIEVPSILLVTSLALIFSFLKF